MFALSRVGESKREPADFRYFSTGHHFYCKPRFSMPFEEGMNSYVLTTRRNLAAARDRQFRACMRERKPFVTVEMRRQYAWVELDLFPTPHQLDEQTQDRITNILYQESGPNATIRIGSLLCSSNKVRIDRAIDLANQLYKIGIGICA